MSFASGSISSEKAPSLGLPFRYFAISLIFLALFGLLLPFNGNLFLGGFRVPGLLMMVHILTLGWITTTILGAAFQLVPVALQVSLFSERLANALLPLFLGGVVTMIVALWRFQTTWMVTGASLLLLAATGYLYLMVRTMFRVRHWDVIAAHVAASVGMAFLIPTLGLLMALQNTSGLLGAAYLPTLRTHLLLAALGYVSLLIIGVSYKLIAMFTLTEDLFPERLAWAEFGLVLAGLTGLTGAFYFPSWRWLGWAGGLALLAGVGIYARILIGLYRHRRRRLFDINTPFTQASLAWFLITLLMAGVALGGLFPVTQSWWIAVAWSLLLGWVGQMIIGQMYKITPFLTWLHRYADLVGVEQVPGLDDLYNRNLALVGFGFWNGGVLLGAAAILGSWGGLMTVAGAILAVGIALFILNMIFVATR